MLPLSPSARYHGGSMDGQENEGNKGGAVYNAGKFSVFDDATFTDNQGSVSRTVPPLPPSPPVAVK